MVAKTKRSSEKDKMVHPKLFYQTRRNNPLVHKGLNKYLGSGPESVDQKSGNRPTYTFVLKIPHQKEPMKHISLFSYDFSRS